MEYFPSLQSVLKFSNVSLLKVKCLVDERPCLFKLLVFFWLLSMKLMQFIFYIYNSSWKVG